ncbi:MAG: GIY-YIG nuclease family protein [Firmicutes bacterium]|nr:GIY-YIG nuclease family protein [Bacillota bacterium]
MKSRRKELVEQYKQMKHDMGIFWIHCKVNDKYFLETSQNLKARINREKFQLDTGFHPNRELQSDWKELGAENFEIEVLELLKYDEDNSKEDYTEELEILKYIWDEKLNKRNMKAY